MFDVRQHRVLWKQREGTHRPDMFRENCPQEATLIWAGKYESAIPQRTGETAEKTEQWVLNSEACNGTVGLERWKELKEAGTEYGKGASRVWSPGQQVWRLRWGQSRASVSRAVSPQGWSTPACMSPSKGHALKLLSQWETHRKQQVRNRLLAYFIIPRPTVVFFFPIPSLWDQSAPSGCWNNPCTSTEVSQGGLAFALAPHGESTTYTRPLASLLQEAGRRVCLGDGNSDCKSCLSSL